MSPDDGRSWAWPQQYQLRPRSGRTTGTCGHRFRRRASGVHLFAQQQINSSGEETQERMAGTKCAREISKAIRHGHAFLKRERARDRSQTSNDLQAVLQRSCDA